MKKLTITSSFLALTAFAACGKTPPPEASDAAPSAADTAPHVAADTAPHVAADTAPAEPDTAKVEDVAKVEDAAPTESPAAAQCKAILAKGFEAVKPNLAKLGYVPSPEQEAAAKGDKGFIDACAALSDELRKCLEDADNPIAAIATCKVNEPSRTVWAPDHGSQIELAPPAPLPAEEQAALLAWIEGTWNNNWAAAQESQRWVVGKEGKLSTAEVTRRGEPAPQANVPESVSFSETRRMSVRWKGSTTDQKLSFLKDGDDVFYASTNLLYDAYPIADEAKFIAKIDRDFVVVDGSSCEVILGTGEGVAATCAFGKDGAQRTFTVEYTQPGWTRPTKSVMRVVGKHLVSQSLFDSGRFVRQK